MIAVAMINFENTYMQLPEMFYDRSHPSIVSNPQVLLFNFDLADDLGINFKTLSEHADVLSGNTLLESCTPLAQAYAGHQFGHFNILGDGRAHLLGEVIDVKGNRRDIQLKGSGQTRYSRRGDGRAAAGPMLREYIMSEAMNGLGIPTTRSLAVVSTGETIWRERELPGAILTRVAASHLRVGTFEYALTQGGMNAVKTLAGYAIHRHYPELKAEKNPYLKFLEAVIEKQAKLVALWMNVGFIHGVMNTDNMTISGETIDYGPCAFMDKYDPRTVFSSIDKQGRYAYGQQPAIAQWNLTRLAETLLPLFDDKTDEATSKAEKALESYKEIFRKFYYQGLRAKFGLMNIEESDQHLFQEFFALLALHQVDYTNTFFALSRPEIQKDKIFLTEDFKSWKLLWELRLQKENSTLQKAFDRMSLANPAVIARNQFVEEALSAATENQDLKPAIELIRTLKNPFISTNENEKYRKVSAEYSEKYQTFCGT